MRDRGLYDSKREPPAAGLSRLALPHTSCPECHQKVQVTVAGRLYGHLAPGYSPFPFLCPESSQKTTNPTWLERLPRIDLPTDTTPQNDLTVSAVKVHSTQKAILWKIDQEEHWLPKSVTAYKLTENSTYSLTIPRWLALKKDLL